MELCRISLKSTDLKDEHDYLMINFGFKHQYYSFHLIKNMNKQIKKHLNKTKIKIKRKIKKTRYELNKKPIKRKS